MRAAVTAEGGFEVVDVDDPRPAPGELLLRVAANGICGSDVSTAPLLPPGIIMGHEFAGEVIGHGNGADHDQWPAGTPVAVMPVAGCGHCRACAVGDIARCASAQTLGLGLGAGALAEFVCVPAGSCVRLDTLVPAGAEVDLVGAAITEPLAVGLHAVSAARVAPGDRVLVIGAGPVGLAVLHWLSRSTASTVVCSDKAAPRRTAAADNGATTSLDPADVPSGAFDVVIECAGKPGVIAAAIDAAAPLGTVVVAGVCLSADSFLPVAGVVKELTLRFVSYYTRAEFEAAARAVVTGSVASDAFVSERAGLDSVGRVIAELGSPGDQRKVLIVPGRG